MLWWWWCTVPNELPVTGLPWILIPIAEEIKSSHGKEGNFQLTWHGQRIQYLHLPIKSIFVSRVNNLCYSPSWKMRQLKQLQSMCWKAVPNRKKLYISNISNHQDLQAGRQNWKKFLKKSIPVPDFPFCSSPFYLSQGDGFSPRTLHMLWLQTSFFLCSAGTAFDHRKQRKAGKEDWGEAYSISTLKLCNITTFFLAVSSENDQCKRKCWTPEKAGIKTWGRGGGCFNKHPTGKGILWRKPETPKWKVQKKKTNERRDEKLGGNRVV